MNQVVHVFIASTKGLVAVQNITDLNDPDLQSVITLNGASDMANISSAYHRFVQKNTGLIQPEFGGTSYRVNLSRNIEQGASWQLGIYLAHYLWDLAKSTLSTETVSLGNGMVEQGDIVFCVTGQVNTSEKSLELVTAVAEKIVAASAQISQWRKQGVLVEFVYPEKNKRQHFPSLDCAMHTCGKLSELIEHVNSLLPGIQKAAPKLLEASHQKSQSTAGSNSENASKVDEYNQSAGKFLKLLQKKIAYLLIPLVCLLIVVMYLQKQPALNGEIEYEVITKVAVKCDANAQSSHIQVGDQYVTQVSPVFLGELCGLYLKTSENIPQVWMITDSKMVMELSFLHTDDDRVWRVNLPHYQQSNRQFYLIMTPDRLDLSDLASLTDYLSRLPASHTLSVESLAEFFTTIEVNPQYLSHRLLVQAE
jgi:hypothetical protein